jgi:hypothetical protein
LRTKEGARERLLELMSTREGARAAEGHNSDRLAASGSERAVEIRELSGRFRARCPPQCQP